MIPRKVLNFTDPVPHDLMDEDIARYEGKKWLHSQREEQRAEKRARLLGPVLTKPFASK